MKNILAVIMFIVVSASSYSFADDDYLRGIEYPAIVMRVVDGDTVNLIVNVWPSIFIETSIRIFGIDAPELRGRCTSEKEKAIAVREYVEELLPESTKVTIRDVKEDKFAGRHDAEIWTLDNKSIGEILIVEGLARRYSGGKRQSWCNNEKN